VKAEKLLYTALIAFIWYEGTEEEKNMNTLLDLLNESETREEDESYKNPVDLLFEELENEEPEHFAVRQYKKYKMAAGVLTYKRLVNQTSMIA
jgi:type IV secretion system protein VirD4